MQDNEKKLWDRVLNGELDIDHPEVIAMETQSNIFANRLAKLRQAQIELSDAKLDMDMVLEEARNAPILEKDRRYLADMPSQKATHTAQQHQLRLVRWGGLAAALLVAGLSFAWYQNTRSDVSDDPGPVMGQNNPIQLQHPITSPDAFDRFEWQVEQKLGTWFTVHVIDLATGEDFTSDVVTQNQWIPETALPLQSIRWYVVMHFSSGAEPVVSPSVEVFL